MAHRVIVQIPFAPDFPSQMLGATGNGSLYTETPIALTDAQKAFRALADIMEYLGARDIGNWNAPIWIDVDGGVTGGKRPLGWVTCTSATGAGTFVYNGTTVNFTAITGRDDLTAAAIVAAVRAQATVNPLVDVWVDPYYPSSNTGAQPNVVGARVIYAPAILPRRQAADNAFTTTVTGTGIAVSGATIGAGGTAPAQAGVNAPFNGFNF